MREALILCPIPRREDPIEWQRKQGFRKNSDTPKSEGSCQNSCEHPQEIITESETRMGDGEQTRWDCVGGVEGTRSRGVWPQLQQVQPCDTAQASGPLCTATSSPAKRGPSPLQDCWRWSNMDEKKNAVESITYTYTDTYIYVYRHTYA